MLYCPTHILWDSFYSSCPGLPSANICPFTSGLLSAQVWAARNAKTLIFRGVALRWQCWELEIKYSGFPLWGGNSGPDVTLSSKVAQQVGACDAHRVTCWMMYPLSDSLPSLAHCPLPSSAPWTASKLNYMHFNPCFSACLVGSPNSDS